MAVPPRVLVVTKRLAIGGAERHLTQVLPELKANGIDVALFVLERGGELEPILDAAGIAIDGVSRSGSHWLGIAKASVELARCIRRRQPDLVHFFLPEAYLVGGTVAMLVGHQRTLMSRRSLTHYRRGRPWFAWLERLMHRRTLALLGNSQAVADELEAETDDPGKVGLIHNGVAIPAVVSDETRRHARARLGFEQDSFIMVAVANLIPYKGHSDLIGALIQAAPQLPAPWHLLIVGRDEGIGDELKAQAEKGGIAGQIAFLGLRDDVESILPAADLALLVSHQEGFSNALLEAMAQGIAVVATAVGGNCDAIEDDVSGRLVPVRDPIELSETIVELANDPDLRQRLGASARRRAVSCFSQNACIERYVRLYRNFEDLGRRPVQLIIDDVSADRQTH
jgi:glycosyltransferase involved in cell wall biosynthesis